MEASNKAFFIICQKLGSGRVKYSFGTKDNSFITEFFHNC